ncbi:MAG TPA: hypothetical protein DEG90_07935 [Porphyromonadaceae bacterium]|nr:hypothetical protein [Porphyromonadaceae bacterium]
MDNALSYNAMMAWTAFGTQDYSTLEQHANAIYNHFVHNPSELLNIDSPLLIGKIFQVCLGFQEPDQDIQEVRAENAFLCFSQALNSEKQDVHDEAAARLMMLLIQGQRYLINKVEKACQTQGANPYSFFAVLNKGLPNDMPMATNTKMLFTAYYLFDEIIDKTNVVNEFIVPNEKKAFEYVKKHVLDNCNMLERTPQYRKSELGNIVFNKICKQLREDIESYLNNM